MPGGTASRGSKKEARHKAENNVNAYVMSREEELKQLIPNDVSVVFVTMSGMFTWNVHVKDDCLTMSRHDRGLKCVKCNVCWSGQGHRRCS